MKKVLISDLKNLATRKGGRCLSNEYLDAHEHLHWECRFGHLWKASATSIKNGNSWCPYCAGASSKLKTDASKMLYTQEIQLIIVHKGGKFLSPKQISSSTEKLEVCCERDHIFRTTANAIKNGVWCLKCNRISAARARRTPFDVLVAAIKKLGGTCLTSEQEYYQKGKVNVRCVEAHTWYVSAKGLLIKKTWCPICGIEKSAASRRFNIKQLEQVAEARNGKLLSKVYKNTNTKMEWECSIGHRWTAVPGSVIGSKNQMGTWCPYCRAGSRSEEICRLYFEQIFNAQFPRSRPGWLRGSRGAPLELDGYNSELKLAFEHQGSHHFDKGHRFFIETAKDQQARDKLKRQLCSQRHITLIEIPELNSMLPITKLKNFIIAAATEKQVDQLIVNKDFVELDMSKIYSSRYERFLKKANTIALERGGECLSGLYVNSQFPMSWRCARGHEWQAPWQNVANAKSWCPDCSGNRRITIAEARQLAESKEGICLSMVYENAKAKLQWKCKSGHIWHTTYDAVRSGKWCRRCAEGIVGDRLRSNIDAQQALAQLRGGRCLSTIYKNNATPLLWECSLGHQWFARPGNIKQGTWCRECANIKLRTGKPHRHNTEHNLQ